MAKSKPELQELDTLASTIPAWELAALRAATGWAEGKQVSLVEIKVALEKLRNRPQGGGNI